MEQTARVGRDRLEIAALSLRVESAERKGGLAGARYTREDNERIAGDANVNVLEVVFARPADVNEAREFVGLRISAIVRPSCHGL